MLADTIGLLSVMLRDRRVFMVTLRRERTGERFYINKIVKLLVSIGIKKKNLREIKGIFYLRYQQNVIVSNSERYIAVRLNARSVFCLELLCSSGG